jgi:hypothetical protein
LSNQSNTKAAAEQPNLEQLRRDLIATSAVF